MKAIVLATTSKYKIALFNRLGFPFTTAAPTCDEKFLPGQTPAEQALRLAVEKATSLRGQYPDHLLIGADQVLALGNRMFTKPGNEDAAVAQVMALAGRTHCLHTAYAILDSTSGACKQRLVTSRLRVRGDLDQDTVRRLVRADKTEDCVGGYKWEQGGIQLFSGVRTKDPNAIVGLPLLALAHDLRTFLQE